jgi:hypothetical protein
MLQARGGADLGEEALTAERAVEAEAVVAGNMARYG